MDKMINNNQRTNTSSGIANRVECDLAPKQQISALQMSIAQSFQYISRLFYPNVVGEHHNIPTVFTHMARGLEKCPLPRTYSGRNYRLWASVLNYFRKSLPTLSAVWPVNEYHFIVAVDVVVVVFFFTAIARFKNALSKLFAYSACAVKAHTKNNICWTLPNAQYGQIRWVFIVATFAVRSHYCANVGPESKWTARRKKKENQELSGR